MRLISRLTALAAALILAVSCLGDPTGPSARVGGLALLPQFANVMASAIVDISKVRVVLRRPGETRAVVDEVVAFPTSGDTLRLGIDVPLQAQTELLELTLAMTNAAGDTVFRAGPIMVTASTDPSSQTPSTPVFTYVGTGANASGVRFVNPPPTLGFGQSVTLAAEAFDAQDATIQGTPVGFELVDLADSVFAKFSAVGGATLVAGSDSGSVMVRAVLPGGQSTTHTIEIVAPGPNVWVSALDGDWSTAANWSRGTVPTPGDSVVVTLAGSYAVNVDVPVTVSRLQMGPASGEQMLTVSAGGSLTVIDTALFGNTVEVNLAGGVIGGPGYVGIDGMFSWTGGELSGSGTTRVTAGGSLEMTDASTRTLNERTLIVAGATDWSDDVPLTMGSGARFINEGNFDWTGGGSVLAAAPPLATFENRGSFTRYGVGMVQMGAMMVDTIGSSWRLDAGDLRLLNGGRMGGNPYTGGMLELVSGTLSMEDGTSWDADGGVVRATGGIVTVDSGATAAFSYFELMGGTLAHEGTVEITGNMQWTGGGISSNTVGAGGLTRLLPGVAMMIDDPEVKTFSGSHVLEVAYDGVSLGGHLVFDGTGDVNAGGGARIVNHARVWMQGTGAMVSNLGPPMAVFENTVTGTLEVTTGALAGTRTMGFAMDNLGTIMVNSATADTLRFAGGSVNNFGGFAYVEVGAIALDAGVYTLTAPWNVQTSLAITGSAQLDLAADTALVGGDLTLRAGGRIRSVSDLALLRVDGNANFGGGASELTAGRLEIGGDFVQSGLNTSFQATGTHVTRFMGNFAQSISFSSPTLATSQFRNLEILNMALTDSVVLASNVYVTDSLYVFTGQLGGVSPHRLVVNGDVNLENADGSNFVRPFVLDVGGEFTNDVGGIMPDTLVLNRAATYPWDGLAVPNGPHLRFNAGVVTFSATSAPGDLIASGNARIVILNSGNRAVLGNLGTRDGGVLEMTVGSDLSVNGDATFAGGGTVGLLNGGRLSIAGDFIQSAVNNNASFAPTVNHVTVLNGATSSSVSFDTPNVSNFDSLFVAKAQFPRSTVTLLTDVRVTGGMFARDGSDIVGPTARLQVTGGTLNTTISTASPTITNLLALELSAPPDSIRSLVSPDTVVLNAGITALPNFLPLQYRSIRLNTGVGVTFGNDTIAGDLDIANGAAAFVGTTNFRVNGKLRTRGAGVLMMLSTDANLWVADSAIFGGGSTNGALTQGALRLGGNFVQAGGDPAAFSATGTHRTWLEGTAAQSVVFANPGLGTGMSHFGDVQIGNETPQGIQLATSAFAEERLLSTGGRFSLSRIWSVSGASLSVEGMAADSITFDGVPLSIGSSAPFTTMSVIGFQNMNPAVNQLTITRPGGTYTFLNAMSFGTAPNTGSYLMVVNNTGPAMSVSVGNAQQPWAQLVGPPRLYLLTGAQAQPTVLWNGQTLPASP